MTPTGGPEEAYRKAELRLRQLLLGDGIETVGRVKGEENRQQVAAELRRMRDALAAILEGPQTRVEGVSAAGFVEELQGIASQTARPHEPHPGRTSTLLTPAQAAQATGLSVSSIYRAVRNGDIMSVRLADGKRLVLRIPSSELRALGAGRRSRARASEQLAPTPGTG